MKMLFVHQNLMSFVQKDLDILQSVYDVKQLQYRSPCDLLSLLIGVFWSDITFSWFGKIHAFFTVLFSKLLGKKAVVVAGGDDVAYEPDINYGMFAYRWKKWCPLFIFHYVDFVLSVSKFNCRETIKNARANPAKVKLLYHGFDAQKFRLMDGTTKEQLAITVGGVDWERLVRKGYESFVRCAAYLPDIQFVVIGKWHDDAIDYLRQIAPENVTFTGRVSDIELLKWLSKAKVYVQASVHEGFGCSVAEAMLCECIPVVSKHSAIPEVVGNCGFYVDDLSPETVADQIRRALYSDLGPKTRNRIKRLYSLEQRRRKLLAAIEELIR